MESMYMYYWRIASMIGLILVASSMPAGARICSVAPNSENEQTADPLNSTVPNSTSGQTEETNQEDEASPGLQMAPAPDIWDGTLSAGNHFQPTISFLTNISESQITSLRTHTFTRSESTFSNVPSQQRWLWCRYPHAPPHHIHFC